MRFFLMGLSMILAIIGQFLLKKGVLASDLAPNLSSIVGTFTNPFVMLGLVSYGFSTVAWLFVLQKFDLSVAYPALSLTYVGIVFVSYLFLNEPLTYNKLVGTAVIIIGVYFLFK